MPRSVSTGYYLGLPKIGRAEFSRKYYNNAPILSDEQNCVPAKKTYSPMEGGNKLRQKGGMCFQNLVKFLAPLGKTQLIAVIALLVLNHYGRLSKKQSGGNYLYGIEKTLAPMGKNALLVIVALLLLNYFTNKNTKKLKGGGKFNDKLAALLNKKYNQQSGGNILEHIGSLIAPMGGNSFVATALLVILNELFINNGYRRYKKVQIGGINLIHTLRNLLMPLGVDSFLTTLGLVVLTANYGKKKGGKLGSCGYGNNALEVIGNKALNYSKDYQQFGCLIPEWGYNLYVDGPSGQSKCI